MKLCRSWRIVAGMLWPGTAGFRNRGKRPIGEMGLGMLCDLALALPTLRLQCDLTMLLLLLSTDLNMLEILLARGLYILNLSHIARL